MINPPNHVAYPCPPGTTATQFAVVRSGTPNCHWPIQNPVAATAMLCLVDNFLPPFPAPLLILTYSASRALRSIHSHARRTAITKHVLPVSWYCSRLCE